MISNIQLLRNIGLFDSVSSGAQIPLKRLTLVYAENGRGKTTLAAILRSLATGDHLPIAERRRLSALNTPHVIVACTGGNQPAMFQNNAWNRTLANVAIFDDVFVDQNIHSGLVVGSGHRQKLHELILGAQAVTLNQQLQNLIARIEQHNAALRDKAAAIPATERGTLSVDEFCALPVLPGIDSTIEGTERNLRAAQEQESIANTAIFEMLNLPAFDLTAIDAILQENLPSVEATAVAQVQAHLTSLGRGGETWVSEGIRLSPQTTARGVTRSCPFCAQDLSTSTVVNHYREYFSAEYANLKRRISTTMEDVNRVHGSDRQIVFERSVRVLADRRRFWSQFGEMPEVNIDTAIIVRDWASAREVIARSLTAKHAAPLDRASLSAEAREAVAIYESHRTAIAAFNHALRTANTAIGIIKESAATSNRAAIANDLARLKATKARHAPAMSAACDDYLIEKTAKAATELQRDQTRADLDQYRTTVFAGYQTTVNLYLQKFNAGFRLDSVTSTNTRGGPSCTYSVLINNTPVAIGAEPTPGQPSFHNTLSAGDRNTLALAFFFASLDLEPGLDTKVVIIDDPISSLDDHRCLTTVQEIRRLADRSAQVIVLSHNKPFLCNVWEGADTTIRAALEVSRDGTGSTLQTWNVDRDCITEYDRRHAMLRDYLATASPNSRDVATAIRPILEGFLRVACSEHFPPGRLLGQFTNICTQRFNTPQEIFTAQVTRELENLIEYANKFHHDTNPAWDTAQINDGELQGFVRQTLNFAKR
jgi:wobble nucleotide-excising tRNase